MPIKSIPLSKYTVLQCIYQKQLHNVYPMIKWYIIKSHTLSHDRNQATYIPVTPAFFMGYHNEINGFVKSFLKHEMIRNKHLLIFLVFIVVFLSFRTTSNLPKIVRTNVRLIR